MLPFYMTKIADPAKLKEIQEKCRYMRNDRGRSPGHFENHKSLDPRYNAFEKPITVTKSTASMLFPSSVPPQERAQNVRWWASDKTNGQRYNLMLFRWSDPNSPLSIEEECSSREDAAAPTDEGCCAAVLIDERFEAHSISVLCNPVLFDGTLFGGELMHPNHMIAAYNPQVAVLPVSVYMAFEVHRLAGRSTNDLSFSEAWEWRSKVLLSPEIYLKPYVDPATGAPRVTWEDLSHADKVEYAREHGVIVSREPDLIVTTKNQFVSLNELALMDHRTIYDFFQPNAYPTEPWGSAVLTPERRHVPGEYAALPTFKFKNCHTFDFEIVVPKDFPNRPPEVYCQEDSRLIRAVIKTPTMRLTLANERRGYDEEEIEGWPVFVESYSYRLFAPGTRNIWECQLAKCETNRCYFAMPKMIRLDKGQPNARYTIDKTMESVDECMGFDWLLERVQQYYGPVPSF